MRDALPCESRHELTQETPLFHGFAEQLRSLADILTVYMSGFGRGFQLMGRSSSEGLLQVISLSA